MGTLQAGLPDGGRNALAVPGESAIERGARAAEGCGDALGRQVGIAALDVDQAEGGSMKAVFEALRVGHAVVRRLQQGERHLPCRLRRSRPLRPFHPAGLVERGLQMMAEHAREAVRLEPANLGARVNLGNALLFSGRPAEAVTEYEAALRLKPDDPQIRANLARARAGVRP